MELWRERLPATALRLPSAPSAGALGDPKAQCPHHEARGAASRRHSRGRVAVTGRRSMSAGPHRARPAGQRAATSAAVAENL